MGRRKVEIKRIESKSNRQVSFCKRRNGLMEKARQLSILCECSVALLIVSSTGNLHSFSSGDSMANIIKHYEIEHAGDVRTSPDLEEEARNHISHKELLEIVQCKVEEVKSDDASVDSLISLEEQFKTALSLTRTRKTELMKELVNTLQEKEKQNQVLTSKLTKMEKKFLETEEEINRSSRLLLPETLPLLK